MYVDTTDTTEDVGWMNRLAAQMRSKIVSSPPTDRSNNTQTADRSSCLQPAI